MQGQISDRTSCQKSGYILTCYVDGRKRFRAVSADDDLPQDHAGERQESDRATDKRLGFASRHNRRPN